MVLPAAAARGRRAASSRRRDRSFRSLSRYLIGLVGVLLVVTVCYYNAIFLWSDGGSAGSSTPFAAGAIRGGTQQQSYHQEQHVMTRKRPLVVYLPKDRDGHSQTIELRHFLKPSSKLLTTRPLALAQSGNAIFENSTFIDEHEEPLECDWMHPWQTQHFYSCNKLHDLDLTDIEFINCGTSRCAFSILADDGKQVTLKIQTYHKDITESRILKNGHDTTSLERLTASPYISDIYGNCAVSQLVEYSRGGNLHDVIKRARMGDAEFGNLSPLTKLKIAYQLLAAVADMHSFESDGVPSLAHNDICCHQFILVDGVFKLNDFHLSVFIEKGKDSHRSCTTDPFYHHSLVKLRAPEEVPSLRAARPSVHVDAVDVYMVGDVLYYLHTNRWVFEGLSNQEAATILARGDTSPIPVPLLTSLDPVVMTLSRAIEMCWTYEYEHRPSARDVSNFVKEQLKLQGVDVDTVPAAIQVTIPPLPKNHRYSDSDFYSNLQDE